MLQSFPRLTARPESALDSLFEAVRLRSEGSSFCASFELSDPRAALARQLAPTILQSLWDFDERLSAFDALAAGTLQIGEHAQLNLSVYDPAVLQTFKDVAKLSDAVVVHSTLQHERLSRQLQYRPRAFMVPPQCDAEIPKAVAGGSRIVIWAPLLSAGETALLAFALEEIQYSVTVVCRDDSVIEGLRANFVALSDPTPLSHGCVVLDACLDHGGNAIAFADAGYRVVSATSSGAMEHLDDVPLYEPWNHRSVFAAVSEALGAPPPRLRPVFVPVLETMMSEVAGPLVSIVVRTYNRPHLLAHALESLRRQTYEHLEVIVVNDGGADVSHIVAEIPNARYIALAENRGTAGAANAGLEATTGKYVGFLDDDDLLFPEHVRVLVDALERSGGAVAHSDTIAAHIHKDDAGHEFVSGYIIFLDGLVEPTDFYVTDAIGPMSVLMKRSLVLAAGGYHEGITHAEDWELYLNLAQHSDFIHVQRVTGIYSIRHDGSNMMSNSGAQIAASMEKLMERYPLPHRPIMETARRGSIQAYRESGYKMRFPEPGLKRQ